MALDLGAITLDAAPLIPWPWIAGLAALALLPVVAGLARRIPGAGLRALAVAALATALLDPTLRREEREALPGIAALIVDRSPSQALGERAAITDALEAEAIARLDALGLETRLATVSRATEDGTSLFEPLSRLLADVPPARVAGALMITDGRIVDAPASLAALGLDAPLHAFVTGPEGEIDRRIEIVSAPRFGIVGREQTVAFRVIDEGAATEAPVRVTLSLDGTERGAIDLRPGEEATLAFTVAHAGENYIEIAAEPLAGQLTPVNDRAVVTVRGVRDALRVLLVSGEPHSGERTWRNLLKSDAAIDLVHFTILRPPEKQDGTPVSDLSLIAFPTHELFDVKLDEFDLIVFDRYRRRGVLLRAYFDNLVRYVDGGGALLVVSGPEYAGFDSLYESRLADVLPAAPTGAIVEEAYRPAPTIAGRRHPVMSDLGDEAAWGRWLRRIGARVEGEADVVMEAAGDPLLVLARRGEGRIAQFLSDHAWLWSRGYDGGGPDVDLLRRTAHWLMKEPDLEEETLRLIRRGGDLIVERRSMTETVRPVTVTTPTGAETTVTLEEAAPGLHSGAVAATTLGLYRASDGERTALINLGPLNPVELARVTATTDVVAPLTEASDGAALRITNAGDAPRFARLSQTASRFAGTGWIGFRESRAYEVTGVAGVPLASGLLGLAALLALLAGVWAREGR